MSRCRSFSRGGVFATARRGLQEGGSSAGPTVASTSLDMSTQRHKRQAAAAAAIVAGTAVDAGLLAFASGAGASFPSASSAAASAVAAEGCENLNGMEGVRFSRNRHGLKHHRVGQQQPQQALVVGNSGADMDGLSPLTSPEDVTTTKRRLAVTSEELKEQTDLFQRLARQLIARKSVRDEKCIGDWLVNDLEKIKDSLLRIEKLPEGEKVPSHEMDSIYSSITIPEEELTYKGDLHLTIDGDSLLGTSLKRKGRRPFGKVVATEAARALHCLSTLFADARGSRAIHLKKFNDEDVDELLHDVKRFFNPKKRGKLPKDISAVDSFPEESVTRTNSTLFHMPNPITMPGGRFVEGYYWDTYWVIRALCLSGNVAHAKSLVENFFSLIDTVGFIPNGTRTYYLDRSQPPVFAECVRTVAEALRPAQRVEFLKQAMPRLLKDYLGFWMGRSNHAVPVDSDTRQTRKSFATAEETLTAVLNGVPVLNRYYSKSTAPRPESFVRDEEMLAAVAPGVDKKQAMQSIRAGAESGWDFTVRWRKDAVLNDTYEQTDSAFFSNIDTINIIPVDLNALLYRYERNVQFFLRQLEEEDLSNVFGRLASRRAETMRAYCWDRENKIWRDYHVELGVQSKVVSAASVVALWAKVPTHDESFLPVPRELIKGWGVLGTASESGQQWDNPNVWPPLLHWACSYADGQSWKVNSLKNRRAANFDCEIDAARQKGITLAEACADAVESATTDKEREIATRKLGVAVAGGWLWNCKLFFESISGGTGACYAEKLCTNLRGQPGSGGEYESQTGFGWSNGVLIEVCARYGRDIEAVIEAFSKHPELVVPPAAAPAAPAAAAAAAST